MYVVFTEVARVTCTREVVSAERERGNLIPYSMICSHCEKFKLGKKIAISRRARNHWLSKIFELNSEFTDR